MAQVEAIVNNIQGLSTKKDDRNSLLSQLDGQADMLAQNTKTIDLIIAQLNPAVHTIGIAFLLHVKVKSGNRAALGEELFLVQVKNLMLNGEPEQLQALRTKVCEICREFTEWCRNGQQPMFGIRPLLAAVEKVRPTPEHLTPVHADLLQLCLLSKNFKPALKVLEQRVLGVCKEGLQARDFLLYFYYGGMVLAALKKYTQALDMLQLAFTMPCHSLHEIVVECYKKYVLISLIVHGEVQGLPKYTLNLVQRLSKSCCADYSDIAQALGTHKVADVEACVEKHKEVLKREGNYGLARQALASVYSRNILRLTQTFVTLSLDDIAQQVALPDASRVKAQILEMIDKGQIIATIDEQKDMVSFDTEPDKTTSQHLLLRLTGQIQVAMELNEKLRGVEESIGASQAYLAKVSIQERQSRWGEPGGVAGEWGAAGAGADEMLDVGEKPPGFNYGRPT